MNYNLNLHITDPTRKNTCIDHIISNMTDAQGRTHQLYLSDHNTGQTLSFETNNTKINIRNFYYMYRRDFNKDNLSKFQNLLSSLTWSDVLMETNLNRAFDQFHETFILYYNLCFPVNKLKISLNCSGPRWLTKGIKKSSQTKRKLRHILKTKQH